MRFIYLSQGASGSASLARSLNLIDSIYAAHGHFPINKNNKFNYDKEDRSHLEGHSMKGIYKEQLNTIFEYLEDCFPNKKHHGLVHTFTIGSLMNKRSELLSNDISISNFVRNPTDVYFSSRNLVNKTLKESRFGQKELFNEYQQLIKENPFIFSILNEIEIDNHNNPFATLEILISSKSISRMFNEAGEYINDLNTFRIEDILKNKQNFLEFLKTTINFDEKSNDIPGEILKKVNSHRKENKYIKNVISKQELVLIDYFLTNSGKEVIEKLYPDNQFLNFDKDYRIPNIFYDSIQEENNKNLRDMREIIVLSSLVNRKSYSHEFIKEKIAKTLESIDQILLNFDNYKKFHSENHWINQISLIKKCNAKRRNIIVINQKEYIAPANIDLMDPYLYKNIEDFLLDHPKIKERKGPLYIIKLLVKKILLKILRILN